MNMDSKYDPPPCLNTCPDDKCLTQLTISLILSQFSTHVQEDKVRRLSLVWFPQDDEINVVGWDRDKNRMSRESYLACCTALPWCKVEMVG
jgi:hypothetical protein